jgi:hypothetical protein
MTSTPVKPKRGSGAQTSPVATSAAAPIGASPQEAKTAGGHSTRDIHSRAAASTNVPDPVVIVDATPLPVPPLDLASDSQDQGAEHHPVPNAGSLLDPALCLAADVVDDIERVRIANDNRLRQLVRVGEDADGEERGFGLDPDHPDVMTLAIMIETMKKLEHEATLGLQRKMRKHPLGAWMKAQKGIGEKQGARLLAAIGDPYINSAKGQPRTVSALWAYCGLHVLPGGQSIDDDQVGLAAGDQLRDTGQPDADNLRSFAGVAARRKKGQRANWSSKAKMRSYLIAESCIKQLSSDCRSGHPARDSQTTSAAPVQAGEREASQPHLVAHIPGTCPCSPYRRVYDKRRAHTATTHPEWTDGHSHNDGLRVASKEILKHLWRAARAWHQEQEETLTP